MATELRSAQLTEAERSWFERSKHDDACLFFAVYLDDVVIGQTFFHDADWSNHESLVGYHIFREEQRGKGTGTAALALLRDYGVRDLGLERLVAITGTDNRASRAIASKAGFREIGPAREGEHLVVYEWTPSKT
jgi:RimJ/RimL family protein N-acetyltransferase